MENLVGIVLCGGSSSRMGRDKGLIKKGWQTWSQRTESLLVKLDIPVYISINKLQLPSYKQYHGVESLLVDSVNQAEGPLSGILSAHQMFPESDLMVVACDMLNLKSVNLEYLFAMYCLRQEASVVTYQGSYLQTLCTVYKASFLAEVLEKIENGKLADFSLKRLINSTSACRISVKDRQLKDFKNSNYQKDLHEQLY